ncbi:MULTISPECIES: DUF4041 domain-containing protein [unclassified Acinetobacter]|uniref:DUF4041 domain-containing protein n=1 Tax=unclassified Acinetobacter TaxID=196816 RepID=UPI0015D1D060|nr:MULTISPECIES: DUF4041 domain-containing protein [unclassified Acinetobacter]QOW48903.1 DUF4041 domain-containing protein [Acinetobacter sp. YH12138]
MINIALIVLIILLIVALLFVYNRKLKNDKTLRSLQENFDRARLKLAETESQQDELNYAISQLRIQNSGLKIQVDKVAKYQHIVDIEQYVEYRTLQADGLVEVTKANADIMLNDIRAQIEQVRQYLSKYQERAKSQIQEQARAELKGLYSQALDQQHVENINRALDNKIRGYQSTFFLPLQSILDQLMDGINEPAAKQNLTAIRCKMIDAMEQQSTANCNYVDEERRLAAMQLFTLVFNSRADLYLAQLNTKNLGELLQALEDDFTLLNAHGVHFSQARVLDSYLQLRLEELKMAALVLHLKETQAHMDVVV